MLRIGFGLGAIGDSVEMRGRAASQAGDLREDEPHPVATLGARAQLGERLRVDAPLRVDEAVEAYFPWLVLFGLALLGTAGTAPSSGVPGLAPRILLAFESTIESVPVPLSFCALIWAETFSSRVPPPRLRAGMIQASDMPMIASNNPIASTQRTMLGVEAPRASSVSMWISPSRFSITGSLPVT